jgi:regulator of sirC expression with transglutaminase-like and TPR domain
VKEPAARVALRALASLADRELDRSLAHAALVIAAEEYPLLDIDACLGRIETLAQAARPKVGAVRGERARTEALAKFLHLECGFSGNDKDYYDPKNSFLSDVLERRLGIPISLAVIYLEVGARVGVPLAGVSFPAHFLLKHLAVPGLYIDPFYGGRLRSEAELPRLLSALTGGKIGFDRSLLEPVGARAILVRMLVNLRGVFASRGDFLRAIDASDRILILSPNRAEELRERGLLYIKLGAAGPAIADLEAFLATRPSAGERAAAERAIDQARRLPRASA